jgi:predicted RNA binding protein YcfA (HicA-like mRNA interferase family)
MTNPSTNRPTGAVIPPSLVPTRAWKQHLGPVGQAIAPGDRMKFRDLRAEIERLGWNFTRSRGSHHLFQHSSLPGTLCIPYPPGGREVRRELSHWIILQARLGVKGAR